MKERYNNCISWIKSILPSDEQSVFIFGYGNSDATNFDIKQRDSEEKEAASYAVKYYPSKRVLVAWDLKLRKEHRGTYDLQMGGAWKDIKPNEYTVYINYPTFKEKKGTTQYYNKVLILGEYFFEDFFGNYEAWFRFNEADPTYPKSIGTEKDSWPSERERKKYSVAHKERDARFHEAVLTAYGYRCAVCRTEIREILQAAHLHGYEVADTDLSADTVEHGICLCANHHLMYDRKIIDFDMRKNAVKVLNKKVINTDAYKEIEKYNFTLTNKKRGC